MKRLCFAILILLLSSIVYGNEAQTEARVSSTRFGVLADFGVGGSFTTSFEYKGSKFKDESDYALTKGVSFYALWPFSDLMKLGVETRFLLWNSEDADLADMNPEKTVDLSPVIRFENRFDNRFMGFVKFAPGFSLYIPSDDYNEEKFIIGNGFGYNIALTLGFELSLSNRVSLISEAGYMSHTVYGKYKGRGDYLGINISYKLNGGQYFFNAGLTF